MSTTTEPSMYERPEKPDWPLNAIPRPWVEKLFRMMLSTYGAKFADLWRGINLDDVKRSWGIELNKLSPEQLKAGMENLMALPKAPNLPEFIGHCRAARAEQAAAAAPRLADEKRADQATVDANLGHIRAASARLMTKEPTAEWAFKLIIRGKSASGKPLPFAVVTCATDAITSGAGKRVVDSCADPELKRQYAEIRQSIVDDYRMRGVRLWEVR